MNILKISLLFQCKPYVEQGGWWNSCGTGLLVEEAGGGA
jgi:hypothetical protein